MTTYITAGDKIMADLGYCECYPLITYEGGTPLTNKEVAHQLHLDIEKLREGVETIADYCPNDCGAQSVKSSLVNAVRKCIRLEGLISREDRQDRFLIDNGKRTILCYRNELDCGKEIFYCWVMGTRESFVVDTINQIKAYVSIS